MGFEELLKETSPELHQHLMNVQEEPLDVTFKYNFCSRCGSGVVEAQQVRHNQWHRDLTFSQNFQLGLLESIAEGFGWDRDNLPVPND